MKKILGSWSGMRSYLETEMLCPGLRGRVRYNCAAFTGMDGCRVFEVYMDGRLAKRFSWETVNTWFIRNGYTSNKDPYGLREYWEEFQGLLRRVPRESRAEYTDGEFCEALAAYRNGSIRASLASPDPLVRMFAVLDRRVGRRTLESLRAALDAQPEWLKPFYALRLGAAEEEQDGKGL